MLDMIINVGRLKANTRSFLSQAPNIQAILTWEQETKYLDISVGGMGIEVRLDGNTMNTDGDYMTDEEKQDIVDKLQVIVNEHNNSIGE